MNYWFLIMAAVLSFSGAVIHGLIGAKIYMGNINASSMEPLTKSLSLVTWHVFTIFLLVSTATLAYVAHHPEYSITALPILGINLLGAALFVCLGMGKHKALLKMPGAYLMGGTALLIWLGI